MNDTRISTTVPAFRYDYTASSEILQIAKSSYGKSVDSTRGSSHVDDYKLTSLLHFCTSAPLRKESSRSNENRLFLEVQRKSFLERFLPDLKFWSQWIDERIAVTTTDSAELNSLDDLFETALSNCASVELANQWTENLLHRHEAELVVSCKISVLRNFRHQLSIFPYCCRMTTLSKLHWKKYWVFVAWISWMEPAYGLDWQKCKRTLLRICLV